MSVGDRELDETGIDGIRRPPVRFSDRAAPDSALDQQIKVCGAGLVVIEAMLKSLPQAVEAKVSRTTHVRSVQKRTVLSLHRHMTCLPCAIVIYRQVEGRCVSTGAPITIMPE